MVVVLCAMPAMAQDADAAYQEALRRIEVMRVPKGRMIHLDLVGLGLESLPPEIGHLKRLEVLNLFDDNLTTLPPEIGKLTNLRGLMVTNNCLTALPPEIGQLSQLEHLGLSGNPLTQLPREIGQLVGLRVLHVAGNPLMSLPPEIGHLHHLQALYIGGTPLTTLPLELGHLTQIHTLTTDPLTFPPPEIISQGTAVTLAYLRDYEAMLIRQTIAGIATGVGAIAGVLLAFRWGQRHGLNKKKKRL